MSQQGAANNGAGSPSTGAGGAKATPSGNNRNKVTATPVPAASPPDENQLRHSAIVASTFANMQLLTTKETLTQYTSLYQAAREDLTKVGEEMVERDRDHIKVVEHLRTQNQETTEKMRKQKNFFEEKIESMKREFTQEKEALNDVIREKDRTVAKLNVTVDQQQADLDALNAFKRERHDIHTEISNYKQRQAEIAIEHEQALSEVKFAALEERVRLKAEERAMRERFETEVSTQAAAMLDVKTREIHAENAQLIEDKVLQQDEIDRLTRENKLLKGKSDEQRRELDLTKSSEEGFTVRCAKQSIEIKELKKQMLVLEKSLATTIEQYEAKLKAMSMNSNETIERLQNERDAAYRNAEGRQKELLKLRAVAKQVVQQRGELEMFFHEALAFVKKQILAERAEQQKVLQIQAQHEHLLRIKGGGSQSPSSPASGNNASHRSQLYQFLPKGGTPSSTTTPSKNQQQSTRNGTAFGSGLDIVGSNSHSAVPTLPSIGAPRHSAGGSSTTSSALALVPPLPHSAPPLNTTTTPSKAAAASSYMAHTASTASRVPPPPLPSNASINEDGFVDIADLSWTDKERVLRILFAKINSKEQQQQQNGAAKDAIESGSPQKLLLPLPPPPPSDANSRTPLASSSSTPVKEKCYLRDGSSTTFFTQ